MFEGTKNIVVSETDKWVKREIFKDKLFEAFLVLCFSEERERNGHQMTKTSVIAGVYFS